jgi:hypothetical protein
MMQYNKMMNYIKQLYLMQRDAFSLLDDSNEDNSISNQIELKFIAECEKQGLDHKRIAKEIEDELKTIDIEISNGVRHYFAHYKRLEEDRDYFDYVKDDYEAVENYENLMLDAYSKFYETCRKTGLDHLNTFNYLNSNYKSKRKYDEL